MAREEDDGLERSSDDPVAPNVGTALFMM